MDNAKSYTANFEDLLKELKQYIRKGEWDTLSGRELACLKDVIYDKLPSSLQNYVTLQKLSDLGYVKESDESYSITPKGRVAYAIYSAIDEISRHWLAQRKLEKSRRELDRIAKIIDQYCPRPH